MVLRLASLAALALAGTLHAQEPTRLPAKAPTTVPAVRTPLMRDMVPAKIGWLGFRTDPNDRNVIIEVAPGSPAERAGIRSGDRIISSDPLSETLELARRDTVRIGNDVTLGTRHTAVSGPIMGRTYEMVLARGNERFAVALVAVSPPEYQRALLMPTRAPGSTLDTLSAEVEAFRTELARTTMQPARKPLARTPSKDTLRTVDSLAKTQPLIRDQALYDDILRRTTELSATLDRQDKDGKAKGATIVDSPELYAELQATLRSADRVALTLDRRTNAISGAEFEQLNPALGYYFGGVTEGVFVLRVGAESPAATAGLEPGDIVETVNGERVSTVTALRERVARATGTITLDLIRKGRPTTVTLRKE